MKKQNLLKRFFSTVSAICLAGNLAVHFPVSTASALADSGLNYTESTEYELGSCDSGYTSCPWIRAQPGKNWTTSISRYSLLLIGIGGYSSAMNEDGIDYDFDEIFFTSLENTLKSARSNGATVGLRFRYDDNGTENPEPADFSQVLRHIEQIGESGLLYKYEDVISFVETGMVGCWGEQWGGKYTSLEHKAQVLDAFLNITPDTIPVTVRTPNTFRQWLSDYCGISTTATDMSYNINDPELAKKAARVGMYNDGYMGSDSDLGTYSNRTGETAWLSTAPSYGGEFSGNDEWRLKYTTWQPEYALSEMYYTNLLRINSNMYRTRTVSSVYATEEEAQARLDEIDTLYENCGLGDYDYTGTITQSDSGYTASWKWMGYDDFIFDPELDSKLGVSCDNSAFYGETVWQFMRAHLGYRFVLRSSMLSEYADAGGTLNMEFSVENTGFSEAPKDKEVEILLSDGDITYTYTTNLNARDWASATLNEESLELNLPQTMHGGKWNVYMRISDRNEDNAYDTLFCTKFANEDLQYNTSLNANYMGSINISGEPDPEKEEYSDTRPAGYYTDSEPVSISETDKVELLDKSYTFTESDHGGYTFLYKIEGITETMQLGNWYTSFTVNGSGYGSAYTTYGLNTRNQELSEDGYYALHLPFFGCVFNCQDTADAETSVLTSLTFNDSRNYWSEDTFTSLGGNSNVTITPIAFLEGGHQGYSVTYHLPDSDITYSDETYYSFKDSVHQSINNKPAVTALSLLDKECTDKYIDKDGSVYKLLGFTTKKDDKSCLIDEDFIAMGTIDLYPYYELDRSATNLNEYTLELTNGADSQGIRYVLDEHSMTASVGDNSYWENNSGLASGGSIIIPAYVVSEGKKYTVVIISENAFSSDTFVTDVTIPSTIDCIRDNSFCKSTTIYAYKGNTAAETLESNGYNVVYLDLPIEKGDVNSDGYINDADHIDLTGWLLGNDVAINGSAADMNSDGYVDSLDLVLLKQKIYG
ncbi:MAG: DUF4832 domain-containing protein [Ruminococcus sp.]|nr:DUF4832 domain-containing protein [Ruminococcus sp.]